MDSAAETLLNIVRDILGDVESVLTRVLEASRELTGARYAALGVLDARRETLARFLTVGLDDEIRQGIGPLPTGRGVLGELIGRTTPLRLGDVGSHPHSFGFPPNHPRMTTFLGVPVLVDGTPYGNLYLTDKVGGADFSEEDEQAVVALAEYAGVAIEHAQRYAGVEHERAQLAQSVEALRATTDITRAVAGEDNVDLILEMIAKRGRALVSARLLVIELLDGRELVAAAAAGEVPSGFIGRRFSLEGTVASAAIRTRRSQRLSEELNLSRFQQHGAGHLGLEVRDGLIVPMIFRGQIEGVLAALDMEHGPSFTPAQQQLLESFADSAAMAVGSAQSAADQRRRQRLAATEAERSRWARELHDETLQALAGVRLGLASARQSGKTELISRAVDEAIEQLQADMDSLRALIADLRPGALDELGVEPAVRDLTKRFAATGIEADLDIQLTDESGAEHTRLLPELETAIYRTVQEALTNIAKHSGATRVLVEIGEADGNIRVSVRDNGQGFDVDAHTAGFGLIGMRERTSLADGRLTISSEPGRGTTVIAEFPVRREPSAVVTGVQAIDTQRSAQA
jgi:two-component system, NarL family, sensor histidine kinase DevS